MSDHKNNTKSASYLTLAAAFAAVAYLSVLIARVIPNVAGFLSYEPKDAILVVAGFIWGPLTSVIIVVLVSFIEMITISATGIYGFVMNVIASCAFVLPATCIYKKYHTRKGALAGLGLSVVTMAVVMIAWNYIITPYYMGVPRETVAGMLATVFLPFNLVKGGLNAALAMLLYKPVVTALRSGGLVPPSQGKAESGKHNFGFYLMALALLITFVLFFLILIGVL